MRTDRQRQQTSDGQSVYSSTVNKEMKMVPEPKMED